jgi:GT2 family glycosyltransferase
MDKIFIAIPVYNRKETTKHCLVRLNSQSFKNFETVVCDDGSTDGTGQMIKKEFPKVTLLKGNGNLYWSGGYNRCLNYIFKKAEKGDYILALNDDIDFDNNYLFNLIKAGKNNPNKLVMSAGYDEKNRNKIVTGMYKLNPVTMLRFPATRKNEREKYAAIDSVSGKGLLIPLNIAKKIGFADQKRFIHMGDHDLSLRCKKYGIQTMVAYDAKLYTGLSYNGITYCNNYSVKNFFNYITDVKSTGNIQMRFRAIIKNRPFYLIPFNLFFDIGYHALIYFKRWFLSNFFDKR